MNHYRVSSSKIVAFITLFWILALGLSTNSIDANDDCDEQVALTERQLSRCDYADRLRAMWLGETIANWTGLTTEAVIQDAPFYTDNDWGLDQDISWKQYPVIDFVFQDIWLADDDTDIEYLYLHLIQEHNNILLSAEQIADGWVQHVNDSIWGDNQARVWMGWGVLPPMTGMSAVYPYHLMADAQLITEIFGALAPGMPDQALRLGELPIRVTSDGYGAHAAQFNVVLYSLATQADPALSPRERTIWLVTESRRYIPDTSKIANVIDIVLADYLDNPDVNDWERTRDLVYERYHKNANDYGFVYRGWRDSAVNFATGLIALLYGEGDFRQTVQIGTLSGWDSDNGTATMGGLLGLVLGYDELVAQFPDIDLSDRFRIHQTRPLMPDYLPDDPRAEDTFTMMAERLLPYIERSIVQAGGTIDGNLWTLPPVPSTDPLTLNPLEQLYRRSANNTVRLAGGIVETSVGETTGIRTAAIADGAEHDFSGQEMSRPPRPFRARAQDGVVTLTVIYDRYVAVETIRFIEGNGGGFSDMAAEVLIEGLWQTVPDDTRLSQDPDSDQPLQMIDFILPEPIQAQGIRVTGKVGGLLGEVIVLELDALASVDNVMP
jgi:hypothetical protein